jgi:integrase
MGHWGTGSGVEARSKSIRLNFTWGGKRRREGLDLAPTPANLRAAAKLVAQINHEIKIGVFNYARHFPGSPVAHEAAKGQRPVLSATST